ncbi:2-hydroxyacid dehydrogenase [Microbulbifer thermotolerans]|uniref:Hydroxyacid dehydrogenase n=1 Tax=Microbulbifer thermotolerans TaxID=252514 RepID=A0A143HL81_MICTH|nr:2-hydroxyacid dehydrogenase [Microbulbifer thermotolerans]AMX02277.1 hydroxyacid dehydrogenase [Microbulbifer thermotolerans]MCX2778738.1 2-hydroxyacid dehydrogenase [Microbulbifer thermotolerans]MCX2784400.1 2-hydroxyacid dehydrogenase [Microbulbifer thermotolerans]MCX2793624.1 2-hydroxyacid dehydrogenase [Microbulbifer thermotolerans]MCX2800808.1 2-hydroxyacid dehydrogenase [Microbulbifer thermotolerans]
MKIAIYNARRYDKQYFDSFNRQFDHELHYIDTHLDSDTLILSDGAEAICVFVNDPVQRPLLEKMRNQGVKMLALRSAGFNHVDIRAANELGIVVANVPGYSPYAVAEHAVAMILCLVRRLLRAHARVHEGNFSLEGLMGFDLHDKTVGIVGTGKIGTVFAHIMHGFGCRLLGVDPVESRTCRDLGMHYVSMETLCRQSDIISLHCPLVPSTKHLINDDTIAEMRDGVCLINTSRGAIIDTAAIIRALKRGKIGYLGLDVYEEEEDLFFEDHSNSVLNDDVFARLLTFNNVLITGHQAYFTREAVTNIARTTLANVTEFEQTGSCANQLVAPK